MMSTSRISSTRDELDAIAWEFLGSEFAGQSYTDWSLDQRIDAYLLRAGLVDVANDGSAHSALVERIMANIGPARRTGLLRPAEWEQQ